jgi:hypothetical protein
MLMGVAMEGDDVVLKAHRKERGQVVLSFDTCSLLSEDGSALSFDDLATVVDDYLRR